MVFAFAVYQPKMEWFMKIEADKYVNIGPIASHFRKDICLKLPHIHGITGCDTTTFFHGVGKVKV